MQTNSQFDWLGKDWIKMKKQLIMLCTSYSDLLFDGEYTNQKTISSQQYEAYRNALLNDVVTRIKKDKIALWQEAVALFAHFERLYEPVNQDLMSMKNNGSVSIQQILGRRLMFYFEDARREIVSYEIDETPAKINTWERLNRLSRKLAIETDTANRCTEAHFEALLNKIREQYAKDYNYPHKLTSIRAFFFKHCDCCHELVLQTQQTELEAYSSENMRLQLEDVLFDGLTVERLYDCLSRLSPEELELLDVAFKLGLQPVRYLSDKAYMKEKAYSPSQYRHAKRVALEKLAALFEKTNYI